MSGGVAVEAAGLRRAFGPRTVLDGLDFAAAPGEFVAVVGRSGCGKTTLLRLLAGLERPDAGTVRISGERAKRAPLVQVRGLGPAVRIVFQDGRLLPWLRVGANVRLGLPEEAAPRAAGLLSRVGLADRAGDWPATLSGGQRQRVALARALASGPGLLLLDEPLSSLDALTRIEMQRLIRELWLEEGFTAVLITHDVHEALALADRVVLLEKGRAMRQWTLETPRPRGERAAVVADEIIGRILAAD